MTYCGRERNWTEDFDKKCADRDTDPSPIATKQNCRKGDPDCRPDRPDVTAPDVGSCLAELARDKIGCQDNDSPGEKPPDLKGREVHVRSWMRHMVTPIFPSDENIPWAHRRTTNLTLIVALRPRHKLRCAQPKARSSTKYLFYLAGVRDMLQKLIKAESEDSDTAISA